MAWISFLTSNLTLLLKLKLVFFAASGRLLGEASRVAAQVATVQLSPGATSGEVSKLQAKYPDLHSASLSHPAPKHGISHSIKTSGRPVFAKARRLDPVKLRIAKEEFCSARKGGIVHQLLVITIAYGSQNRWVMAPMWGFLKVECGYSSR
jgi:hypothetical protein